MKKILTLMMAMSCTMMLMAAKVNKFFNINVNGYAPCAYTAWEREAMGWINIPTLDASGQLCTVELKPIDSGGTAYRILNDNDPTGNEYLIVEDIQLLGINSRQRGHGMLMYHVNYDSQLFSLASNSPNNEKGHPRMTVVPADNLLFSAFNVGKVIDGKIIRNADIYSQLAGDPFPGTSGQTSCSDETALVSFAPYVGEAWNKAFQNITEHDDRSITFTFVDHITDAVKAVASGDTVERGPAFNIIGQRVGQAYKGIMIRNSRKYTQHN